ncbi:39S ribosomal protein L2, mitochondrial-like isoform X2 [Mizuhopecten yessoensis]|uniref:39S ribosomal protein L2, mitochondrial n=1 Tax=Mizuhopecten yessoensis TaxID=6573 RepID=A0A210PZP8_MIZYE|nr:39S ribosomal protein L2, mitochondrial-like isoform X2 [Mizuhopecten yessoensis]OWF41974.1 39S ribosomal protein L2, mitochondrial [Mizuhopecten yessoensis]
MASLLCKRLLSTVCKVVSENGLSQQPFYQRYGIHTAAVLESKHRYSDKNIDLNKNTLRPQKLFKSGGRDPETGRVIYKRIGGGHKQSLRLISYEYNVPESKADIGYEKIIKVRKDPCRTAHIAIAATGNRKRYILASDGMQDGDIIRTHANIPDLPVTPELGNQYPVGSLPVGTIVHNIERWPGKGGRVARAAGSSGMITRKLDDNSVVISMPSKREMRVDQYSMATIGKVSNVGHQDVIIGKAGRNRWKGIRPSSGLKQKKSGYHGRKLNKPRAMANFIKIQAPTSTLFKQNHD